MRLLLIVTFIATVFYLMTGLVFFEGSFEGALVVKPYPMRKILFGGGEAGTWARHHPGQPPPWFMQNELRIISEFSWEEGDPAWVTAYEMGVLTTLLAWVALAVIGVVKLLRVIVAQKNSIESIKFDA
ncbi:MAG TPA: hypothetical protein VIT88_00845 [Pyrinomonadaceae bacterium]